MATSYVGVEFDGLCEIRQPEFSNTYWIDERYRRFVSENVITRDKRMIEIFDFVGGILELDTTVLIHGETGTGKELLASAIHSNGPRKGRPFVAVNCAAIPDELFESELFGHKKGAFTGAAEDRKGYFQAANGGTILLDEIGEIPFKLQSKLLRVIEDKKVTSLGSDRSVHIDVRIVAATNKDLELEVERGNFREDLFYRLNIIPIKLPPLRERKEDIPLLARFFLRQYAEKFSKPVKSISPEVMNTLVDYPWHGNVRELKNVIERAVILEKKEVITNVGPFLIKRKDSSLDLTESFKATKDKMIEGLEKTYISRVLELYGGKLTKAAKHADMDVKNFCEKMKKYGIKRDTFLR